MIFSKMGASSLIPRGERLSGKGKVVDNHLKEVGNAEDFQFLLR